MTSAKSNLIPALLTRARELAIAQRQGDGGRRNRRNRRLPGDKQGTNRSSPRSRGTPGPLRASSRWTRMTVGSAGTW